jgi:hypothetical protein
MPILTAALLAIMLVIIVVLLVVLIILYLRNYRRYGSIMPPGRAKALPPTTAPAAGASAALPSPQQPPAAAPAAAYLEPISNGGASTPILLNRPVTVIGRDPACDIRIDEQFVTISRRHAQIEREDDSYILSDISSSSGVYVDGARIGRNRVQDGAVIQIGQEVQFTFHQAPARGAP